MSMTTPTWRMVPSTGSSKLTTYNRRQQGRVGGAVSGGRASCSGTSAARAGGEPVVAVNFFTRSARIG